MSILPSLRRCVGLIAIVVIAVATAACGDDGSDSSEAAGRLSVVAAFYPLEEAAAGAGGDRVDVEGLTPAGQGPHDLELQARQIEALDGADVVFYLGRGFQPQVEDAVSGLGDDVTVVDLLDHVDLLPVDPQLPGTDGEVDGEVLEGDVDPHVWLDPARMIAMVDTIVDTLSEADPDGGESYETDAQEYLRTLSGLDSEYEGALSDCRSRVIVTSHRAFGYLAERYELRQIPIAGISPEVEPDPATLEAIAEEARKEKVTTIFLESLAPPDLAETVAREVDAELSLLDPIEGLTADQVDDGTTYSSIMRENLDRLVKGLDCS